MKLTPERIERDENIKFLDEIMDVLNRMDTSVEFQNGKYIVINNGDKKFEITITHSDTSVRYFNNGMPGAFRVINKEGLRVKNKLWYLKFKLEDETSTPMSQVIAEKADDIKLVMSFKARNFAKKVASKGNKVVKKVKTVKNDIDLINKVLTVLMRNDTSVSVEHETNVMKKYEVSYNTDNNNCKLIVEYAGSLVKFTEDGVESTIEAEGYMGWKLGVLRRDLDKKVAPRVPFMTRLAQKLKTRQYQ